MLLKEASQKSLLTILFALKVEYIASGNKFYRSITDAKFNFNFKISF